MENQVSTAVNESNEAKKSNGFFAGYKNFGSLSTGSKIVHILLPVALIAIVAVICLTMFSTDYVALVKEGKLNDYPDKTVGEAFEDFFADPSWEEFVADNGKQVVEFKGTCEYYGEDAECLIQFVIDEDDETFEIYTAELDGEPLNTIEIAALIEVIYE